MPPSPPTSQSGRRRSGERSREAKKEESQSRRRAGNDSSEDSAPEVEFRAFMRPAQASSSQGLSASPSFNAATGSRPIISNGKPTVPAGRMRGGAPRLGGLGLGGLANQQTAPRRAAPIPASRSSSSVHKVRRKATPSARYPDDFPVRPPPAFPPPSPTSSQQEELLQRREVLVDWSAPTQVHMKRSLSSVERPFLSPEMPVTTARVGAFALDRVDRPVPASSMRAPTVALPDSPPTKERKSLDERRSSIGSIAVHPDDEHDSQYGQEEEEGSFGLLQAALAEGSRQSSASLLVTPETDQGNRSFPSSPMDPTPPTSRPRFATPPQSDDDDEEQVFASPASFASLIAPSPIPVRIAPESSGFSSSEESPLSPEHYRSSTSSNNASDTTDSGGPRTPPPVHRQIGSPLVRIISAETIEFVPTTEQEIIQDREETDDKMSRSSSISSFGSDQSSVSVMQVATASHISIPPPRSSSSTRNRGPTPPRPKRMRMPAINSIVEPVAAEGLLGGEVPVRSRGLFADGEDIEDDGGGGGGAGAYSTTSTRSAYRSSVVSSNSTTPSTLSRNASVGKSADPPKPPTPPITIVSPPALTSRAKLFLALEAEKEKERLRAADEAAELTRPSPDLASSPSSFVSTSASEAESGNESFFYRPPPVRMASDQSAATVTSSNERYDEPVVKQKDLDIIAPVIPLVSPPLVETPKITSLEDSTVSPLVSPVSSTFSERPTSTYFGLGLRLPSSITPSSSRNSLVSSDKPVVATRYFTAPLEFDTPPRATTPPPPAVEAPPSPVKIERPASPIVIERAPSPPAVIARVPSPPVIIRPATPPTPVRAPSPVTPLAIPAKTRAARVRPPSAVVDIVSPLPSPPVAAVPEPVFVAAPLPEIVKVAPRVVKSIPVPPVIVEAKVEPPVIVETPPTPSVVDSLPIPFLPKSVPPTPSVVVAPTTPLPVIPAPVEVPIAAVAKSEESTIAEDTPTRSYSAAAASTAASLAISGGMLLGYGAWRGLATAASVGGSSLSWGWKKMAEVSEASAAAAALEVEQAPLSPRALGKRRATVVPGSFASPVDDDDSADETFFSEAEETMMDRSTVDEAEYEVADDAESSIVETEWGDMHFPAPEGFLEDLKRAMAEVGPEDQLENEKVEREAQEAAYAAASRAHDEADSPSSPVPLPFPSAPSTVRQSHSRSQSSASSRTLKTRARAEEANEMEELADQFSITSSDPPASPSRIASPRRAEVFPSIPSNRQYSPSLSTRSIASDRSSVISNNINTGMTHSVSKRSLFGFGSVGRKRISSDAGSFNSFAPLATSASLERTSSQLSGDSSNSNGKSSKRGSMFGGMKPSPSVESDIGNATYVSYSSGASKTKRRTSGAISMSDFFSGDSPTSSVASDSRSIKRDRRSSLRRDSRYDMSKVLALSESIAEAPEPVRKSIYSVRFANASGGSGLKSVAESEAERAGGESHGQRWVGIGRGRYGNLVVMSDEASDQMYAEQTLEIKKKWRSFGMNRDWSDVKID